METLQRMANRGSISTGYDIDNSCKFEADNSESMARTNGSEGDKQKCTLSVWVKRTELADGFFFTAGDNANPFFLMGFYQNKFYWTTTAGVSADGVMQTNRMFRDCSAWYHIVLAIDTTQGTDTNRYKLYVNGVQETSFGTANYPAEDANLEIMDDVPQDVGGYTSYFYCGYIAEFVAIDGSQLAPTSFGEFDEDTGIWKPIDVSGLTFGTNGFWLDFEDSSNLGNDASGGTDFTETNIAAADQATDTPTNNFCIMSPLWNYANDCVISDGGSYIDGSAAAWNGAKATFGLTAGKWYWEIKQLGSGGTFMGLQTDGDSNIGSGNAQSHNITVVFYTDGTLQYSGGSESTTSASNSITTNSIVGFALDLDSGTQTIKIYLNGSLITTFGSSGTCNLSTYNIEDTTVFPFVAIYENTVNMNFGGYTRSSISSAAADANGYGTFEHAPPTGYYALCTKNLSEFGG